MSDANVWTQVLDGTRADLDPEESRRWLSTSSYASDWGDLITVWVPSAVEGRHITQNYLDRIKRELVRLNRPDTLVRFVATGFAEDEEEEEREREKE